MKSAKSLESQYFIEKFAAHIFGFTREYWFINISHFCGPNWFVELWFHILHLLHSSDYTLGVEPEVSLWNLDEFGQLNKSIQVKLTCGLSSPTIRSIGKL